MTTPDVDFSGLVTLGDGGEVCGPDGCGPAVAPGTPEAAEAAEDAE